MTALVYLDCDVVQCVERYGPGFNVGKTRTEAGTEGWTHGNGWDRCPEHEHTSLRLPKGKNNRHSPNFAALKEEYDADLEAFLERMSKHQE